MQTDKEIDNIFEATMNERITLYSSFLKKRYTQKVGLYLSSLQIMDDAAGREKRNICVNGYAIDIRYNQIEALNHKRQIVVIFPKITFAKMCFNKGFDFRNVSGEYELWFKVLSKRVYELEKVKEIKNEM